MEQLIRQRTNAALAGLPPAERRLRHDEERKRQEAIYRQERDEKAARQKLLKSPVPNWERGTGDSKQIYRAFARLEMMNRIDN